MVTPGSNRGLVMSGRGFSAIPMNGNPRMIALDRQHRVCQGVRDKIAIQGNLEVAGSPGAYNGETLKKLELQECGSNR
jgi:hypothetical protein